MTKTEALIQQLQLEAHVEGGFFRRTYESDERPLLDTAFGPRLRLTSILYLLTRAAPIGRWHLNRSDILHFYHLGDPINYYLLEDGGQLSTHTLGPDPSQGQRLQLLVPGGVWKASHLPHGEYGLISEAVCPGFDFEDMSLGERSQLLQQFPQHAALIEQFTP